MARIENGLLNDITGLIGNVVVYRLNKQIIIRSKNGKPTKPPSLKQLAWQQKMKVVNNMMVAVQEFVKIGFKEVAEHTPYSAFNAATGYQMKHAIAGVYPDLQVDYSKVLLSKGPLCWV